MGWPARRQAARRRVAHAQADAACGGSASLRCHWPAYAHDWADLLAQQEADEADKQRAQHEQNRTRLRPSSVEIMHCEQSIAGRRAICASCRSSCGRCRRLPSPGHATATWMMRHAGCGFPGPRAQMEREGCADRARAPDRPGEDLLSSPKMSDDVDTETRCPPRLARRPRDEHGGVLRDRQVGAISEQSLRHVATRWGLHFGNVEAPAAPPLAVPLPPGDQEILEQAAAVRGLSVPSFVATLVHTITAELLIGAVMDDDR